MRARSGRRSRGTATRQAIKYAPVLGLCRLISIVGVLSDLSLLVIEAAIYAGLPVGGLRSPLASRGPVLKVSKPWIVTFLPLVGSVYPAPGMATK